MLHGMIVADNRDQYLLETNNLVESPGLGKLKRGVQKAECLPTQASTLHCSC